MNTKSSTPLLSLSVPVNLEQEQDERQQKNRWKVIYATSFAILVLVAYRAGYVGNKVGLQGRSSVMGSIDVGGVVECLGSLRSLIGFVTCAIGNIYPPIIEGVLAPLDPIDLGGDWSQTVQINVPKCPSTASVTFDLGSLVGLSSIEIQGLTLEREETKCIETILFVCVKSSFKAVWTEHIVLQSLDAATTASLEGISTCLGEIDGADLSGTASLKGLGLGVELYAEGTYGTILNPSFEITKASTEKIDLEEGILNAGISFSAWENDVFDFKSTYEEWLPIEIDLYLQDVVKEGINNQLNGLLPFSYP